MRAILAISLLLSACGKLEIPIPKPVLVPVPVSVPAVVTEVPALDDEAKEKAQRKVPEVDPCQSDNVPNVGCTVEDFCRGVELDPEFVANVAHYPHPFQIVNQDVGLRPQEGPVRAYMTSALGFTPEQFLSTLYIGALASVPGGGPEPVVLSNHGFLDAPAEAREAVRAMACSAIAVVEGDEE